MRRLCLFLSLSLLLQFFLSCQKQVHDTIASGPTLPGTQVDSVVLIKSIKTINYDAADVFLWQTEEHFTYDKILNKTVVAHADSSVYINGQVTYYTETFQYNAQNRLSQFTSSNVYESDVRIDFSYNESGDLSKAVIQDQKIGQNLSCDASTSMTNGRKTITVYDTSNIVYQHQDSRPQIYQVSFDADNRLVHQSTYSTSFQMPGNLYRIRQHLRYIMTITIMHIKIFQPFPTIHLPEAM